MTALKQTPFKVIESVPFLNKKRNIIISIILLGTIVVLSIGWWLASPLFTNTVVDEAFPFETPGQVEIADTSANGTQATWIVARSGQFVDVDFLHRGSGSATIVQQGDKRVLRLEDFAVTNGPDLHVLLVENIEGTDNSSMGEHLDLGALKGNIGNQNYEIPANVDLSKYQGVMIYCEPFHVVFSTATFGNEIAVK
ncbi:MAG: DM13 domain-containing protein [Chloroflexota bacterium]